jgi:YegS/Rv2252/BmrU family lipid kinase
MKIEVILNARSGTDEKKDLHRRLQELFVASGIDARISIARAGASVVELAHKAARSDADIIIAGGGDGTINSVASVAIGSGKTMGVLPFGTMNHFAKDLHIPLDLEGAIETIVAGHVIEVDVGEVNDRIFVNNSSLGLYPNIVREREKQQRLGWGKWPAYVWAALAVLRRYPFLNVRLGVDGKEFQSRTPFVFIGNNEYEMESLNVGGRACLDAGKLSLYMSERTSRLGLLRLALRALFGGLRQEKDFIALCTKEVWIGTKHKHVRVALDGEVLVMKPPLHYRVRPRSLSVLAPIINQNREQSRPGASRSIQSQDQTR